MDRCLRLCFFRGAMTVAGKIGISGLALDDSGLRACVYVAGQTDTNTTLSTIRTRDEHSAQAAISKWTPFEYPRYSLPDSLCSRPKTLTWLGLRGPECFMQQVRPNLAWHTPSHRPSPHLLLCGCLTIGDVGESSPPRIARASNMTVPCIDWVSTD